MSIEFAAGVDGGGTKTTVICRKKDGALLDKKVFGPFNINSIGESAFKDLLREILSYLDSLGTCKSLCIGAAGISNRKMVECVSAVLSDSKIRWSLVGDYEIALTGALDGKDYNLKGQQVNDQATSKGMYILNGKKVIIKK